MKAAKKFQIFFETENMKIFIAVIVLFAVSLPLLIIGPTLLGRIDGVVAQASASTPPMTNLSLPEVAAVEKTPSIAILAGNVPQPQFSAWATIAVDYDTGQILYQNNIHVRHAPASTTKLMTALVSEDLYQTSQLLTVPPTAAVGGSVMGLLPGEKLTYRGLLYGMLLDSGNDAAYTLAVDSPGGFSGFVNKMNQKAQDLGLADTHFENPAGFDHPNHYSSAFDLSQIAKQAAQDPQIARVVSTMDTSVTLWLSSPQATGEASPSAKVPKTVTLHNLNQLLNVPGVIGMKTGTTENAGENLVGLVDRNNHKIITVMLGSKNRFVETEQLINWIYNNYSWSD